MHRALEARLEGTVLDRFFEDFAVENGEQNGG